MNEQTKINEEDRIDHVDKEAALEAARNHLASDDFVGTLMFPDSNRMGFNRVIINLTPEQRFHMASTETIYALVDMGFSLREATMKLKLLCESKLAEDAEED